MRSPAFVSARTVASTPRVTATSTRIHWPAVLTVARVVLAIPVVILTLAETRGASYLAFAAFGVAALTDGVDGAIARRMDLESASGQFWDPIADKILVLAAMAGLVVVGRFPAWAAIIIVVRELAVSALRIVATRRGRGFPPSKTGKAKTGAELLAVLLFILPVGTIPSAVELSVLIAAVVLAVVSGVDYLVRARRILSDRR